MAFGLDQRYVLNLGVPCKAQAVERELNCPHNAAPLSICMRGCLNEVMAVRADMMPAG